MTVSTTTSRVEYAGNGSTVTFSVPFYFLANGDLKVYSGGTLQTLTTHYSVTGAGDDAGGSITFVTAPANGDDVIIFRDPAITQSVDYVANDPFPAETHETALDRLTMIAQRVRDMANRSLMLDDSIPTSTFDMTLTTPTANTVLAVNAAGDAIVFSPYASLGSSIFVSAADFDAVGDGLTDDTAALQAAADLGGVVILQTGLTYLITSAITMSDHSGFVCPNGRAYIKAKTGTGGFNVTNVGVGPSGDRTDTDRNMILCDGVDDIIIHNIGFTTDGLNEVVLHGINLHGGMATRGFDLRGLTFDTWPCGICVKVDSVGDGKTKNIDILSAEGCYVSGTTWTGGTPQTTVVQADADQIGGAASAGVRLNIGSIKDWIFSGSALSTYGAESDGVTLASVTGNKPNGWHVTIGSVDGCGEVIDCFGEDNTIDIGAVKNINNDALKLIHGAKNNRITLGTAETTGRSVVVLAGSNTADQDIEGNSVSIGSVNLPGTYGTLIGSATSVVLLINTDYTKKPINNHVHVGSVIGDGVNMDYVVRDGGYRIYSAKASATAQDTATLSFLVSGTGRARDLTITLSNTFVATVTLQRSTDNVTFSDINTYTTANVWTYNDGLSADRYYRLKVKTGDYTSGTVDMLLRAVRQVLGNEVTIGRASGWALYAVSAPQDNVRVRHLAPFYTRMVLSADQTGVVTDTATKIAFDAVSDDLEGVSDITTGGVTLKWPGLYQFDISVRMNSLGVGATDPWKLYLYNHNTPIAQASGRIQYLTTDNQDEVATLSYVTRVEENQIEDGSGNSAKFYAYWYQKTGANKTISSADLLTRMTVTRLA